MNKNLMLFKKIWFI